MTNFAFRALDPLFNDPLGLARTFFEPDAQSTARADFMPRFDVTETDDEYCFEADLPGVKEEALEVTLDGRTLTIAGSRERTQRAEGDSHIVERVWGRFSRSFRLPATADAESISADLHDGVLTVNVAKKPEVKPRKVPIGKGREEMQGKQKGEDPKLSAAS